MPAKRSTTPTTSAPSATLRVAFWNTWLLSPRLWPSGPRMPGLQGWFAPDVEARAPLVAEALAGRFDIVAISECFERSEQEAVAHGWPGARFVEGPQRRLPRLTGSGLATLVDRSSATVERVVRHHFRSGGDIRDSDTFASKGALFARLLLHRDLPPLELVSTHLFAGGDLFPIPGASDAARHHEVRMAQVDELVGLIEREHDPASPLLLVGDLNVAAHDPDPRLADPGERYRDLCDHLARAQLVDLWPAHGTGAGSTCTFADAAELPPDPDDPDAVLDDPEIGPADAPGERIDYLFLHAPEGTKVDVGPMRRWAFPGRDARGGPAGSLSDHLALSVELTISA